MYNLLFGGRRRGSKNRTRSFRRRSVSKRRVSKRRSSKRSASKRRASKRRAALKRVFEGLRKMSRKGKPMIHHNKKWYATFNSPVGGEYVYKGAAKRGSRRVKHRVSSLFA